MNLMPSGARVAWFCKPSKTAARCLFMLKMLGSTAFDRRKWSHYVPVGLRRGKKTSRGLDFHFCHQKKKRQKNSREVSVSVELLKYPEVGKGGWVVCGRMSMPYDSECLDSNFKHSFSTLERRRIYWSFALNWHFLRVMSFFMVQRVCRRAYPPLSSKYERAVAPILFVSPAVKKCQ